MRRREIQWINSPVISEAIVRYEENRLSRSMSLWIENLLEINHKKTCSKLILK